MIPGLNLKSAELQYQADFLEVDVFLEIKLSINNRWKMLKPFHNFRTKLSLCEYPRVRLFLTASMMLFISSK